MVSPTKDDLVAWIKHEEIDCLVFLGCAWWRVDEVSSTHVNRLSRGILMHSLKIGQLINVTYKLAPRIENNLKHIIWHEVVHMLVPLIHQFAADFRFLIVVVLNLLVISDLNDFFRRNVTFFFFSAPALPLSIDDDVG